MRLDHLLSKEKENYKQKDKIYKNLFLINFIHLHCEVLSKRKHNYRGNSEGIYSITFLERAKVLIENNFQEVKLFKRRKRKRRALKGLLFTFQCT